MKTVEQKTEVGIIVARFQSPYLHEGHQEILNIVISNHPRVIVFLGLSPLKCTTENPYDFATRRAMLEEKYPNIEVYYIDDVGDDEIWSKNLDRMIAKTIGPSLKVVLYGSRDSFIKGYKGHYPTIELVPTKFISSSEIRREAGIKAKHTLDFRIGVAHAVQNQYPTVHPTVDFAIINFEKCEVLLARKPNEELLRFPGGFADINSPSYEADVIREAKEETGLTINNLSYIGSALIDDWRYRRERNKIKTLMFVVKYDEGVPKADDDIADVRWVKFTELNENNFVPTHRPLAKMLREWWATGKTK
jgi:bifunctional NMN adenylyltransferase/nudix hydrolase